MARITLSAWFSEHPDALHATLQWLEDRRAGLHTDSLRGWFRALQGSFGFPFRDHTSLLYWLSKHHDPLYTEAMKAGSGRFGAHPVSESFKRTDRDLRDLSRRQDFLITCAVNNCDANTDFLAACERWRAERQGIISINPVRYYNPKTQRETKAARPTEWWDPALRPYMLEDELRPHPLLSLMTTKAQATAANPLPARLDGRTKARSAVFGHPQLAMRTVPTPQHRLPKILYSSGAVTEKGYSDSLAGDMAEFHHSFSAVIAEVRGDRFHLREIVWDGEKFIDYDRAYYADRTEDAPPPAALVMGDVHVGLTAEDVMEATFDSGGIFPTLEPEALILHDLSDGRPFNPHEAKNRLSRAALARRGLTSVQGEFDLVAAWLEALPTGADIYVVRSNHDAFLDRWLQQGEKGVEAENLAMYHELSAGMLRHEEEHGEFPLAIELALRGYTDFDRGDVKFLRVDESLQVRGVETGMHGHLGPNGARGAPGNMSRIGVRFVCGHIHGPVIWQGGYWSGMSTDPRHGYNLGPSNWFKTHVLIHDNGRRQMAHMIDGYFRG